MAALEAATSGATSEPAVAPPPAASTRVWTPATLHVRDVAVARGDRSTPRVSLQAEPGEVVAIVGPTGSGKTSFLRALLGLEPEGSGEIRYGDEDLSRAGVGPGERPFAWVPQEPAIVAATLAENVALASPGGDDAGPSVAEALEAVGAGSLAPREGDHLSAGGPELSGGERQWVALARALSTGLPVLLLDEPTAGLDARSQERVLRALAALRGKRTVLVVTHRPEPLALADRIVRLDAG
jgi:ABC-type transport system involved in cytochrome bd biosynthesis fused ATPase/permease subunit